jgi:hypothetical protein
MAVRKTRSVATPMLVITLLLFAGCAESNQQRAQRMEGMLMEAGFRAVSANTPVRVERLNQMSALKLRYSERNGHVSYWFADPFVCHCLYVGSQKNYNRFQQLRQERDEEVADENEQQAYQGFMASPAGQVFYGESD